MKLRYITGSIMALLIVLAISAVACGDDDGGDNGGNGESTSEIRTEKGLTVANIDVFQGGEASDGDDVSAAGAPVPQGPAIDEAGARAAEAGYGADIARGGGLAPFPAQVQASGNGLTVAGYGTATADADSARIEFYFGKSNDKPIPLPEPVPDASGGSSDGSAPSDGDIRTDELQEVTPITEDELQPVIDALVGAGANPDGIEFVGQNYYDPYWSNASLRVTVDNLDALEGIINAGNEAAANLGEISLQSSNVMYTISDCSALKQAALEAAIENADENVQTFAAALGVTAGEILGASNYSYYAEDGSSCSSYWGYYPVDAGFGFIGGATEVSVYAQVSITYAMQ